MSGPPDQQTALTPADLQSMMLARTVVGTIIQTSDVLGFSWVYLAYEMMVQGMAKLTGQSDEQTRATVLRILQAEGALPRQNQPPKLRLVDNDGVAPPSKG